MAVFSDHRHGYRELATTQATLDQLQTGERQAVTRWDRRSMDTAVQYGKINARIVVNMRNICSFYIFITVWSYYYYYMYMYINNI